MAQFWARALPSPGVVEYAEGDTGTWVWMLRHGEPIYGGADALPMRHTNYPPLGLALVARLAPSDGAILLTGRLLSLASFALLLALVALSVRRATGAAAAGAFAALALAATLTTGFWAAVCRPDAPAAALGALGVTLVALRVRGWPLLAAAAFAASLLTKHSLIVFPAGTIGWALYRQPRRGALLALATIGLVGAAVAWGGIAVPLFAWSSGGFRPTVLLLNLATPVAASALGAAIAAIALRRWAALPARAREVLGPWSGVFAAGLLWLPALGRIGASFNYAIELLTALVVLSTAAVALGFGRRLYPWHALATVANTAGWLGFLIFTYIPRAADDQRAAAAAVAASPGPVLAEQSWWATGAGRPPLVIQFLTTQLAAAHRFDPESLGRAAREGGIDLVLLSFPLERDDLAFWHSERFPPGVLEALRGGYQLERLVGGLYVYRPRARAPARNPSPSRQLPMVDKVSIDKL
jgi:hypothetical protein